MTAVKRMTATEDFLQMSIKDRNCEVELYEDCRNRKLLEECNCVPSEVAMVMPQVGYCLNVSDYSLLWNRIPLFRVSRYVMQ